MSSQAFRVNDSRRPHQFAELLTLSEACLRFGVRPHRIYAAASQGLLHPVQPNGRILYPEWEIEAALRADNATSVDLFVGVIIAA